MPQETIRAVLIWSGWIRLLHGVLALEVIFLAISATVLRYGGQIDQAFWQEWHLICGQILLLTVVARLFLLFVLQDSGSWRALLPDPAQTQAFKQMALFYLSAGRTEMPNWFAHNPFWRPVYPFIWLLLLLCGLAGLLSNSPNTVFGMTMFDWHTSLANLMLWISGLHVVAALLHDIKGKGAAISAMLNGYRYFYIKNSTAVGNTPVNPFKGSAPPVYVSLESIKKRPPADKP